MMIDAALSPVGFKMSLLRVQSICVIDHIYVAFGCLISCLFSPYLEYFTY